MCRDDSIYLNHILDAISKIEEYLQGIDAQEYVNDLRKEWAHDND